MAKVFKTYGEKLLNPKWQRKRLEIMRRDNFSCRLCADRDTTLNIHHLKYVGDPWDVPDEFLWTLCADCHSIISANNIDLLGGLVSVRKILRGVESTIFMTQDCGVSIFIKKEAGIGFLLGISNESMRFLVHDTINFWLQNDRNHYLTEKLPETNG